MKIVIAGAGEVGIHLAKLLSNENYVKKALRSAGGKGINVSKALCALGAENRAIAVLGSENSAEFLKDLPELDLKVIETDQHQVFGRMSGKAILDDGEVIEIKDVMCFAEKVRMKY